MQVWEVRVAMNHRGVTMRMRVRFANGVVRRMVMLMVIVMAVCVLMLKRLMCVLVIVPLDDMKIDA